MSALKLEHLRQFLAVAQHHNLQAAANALHRTPSALSMTLKHMEEVLGGPLFEGERKRQLSPLGRYVLQQAERSVGVHQQCVQDIQRFARGDAGWLRIAAVPSVATTLLPPVVKNLMTSRPQLKIELRDIDSVAVEQALLAGDVDIGVASLAQEHTRIKSQLILQDPFVCLCPRGHPLTSLQRPLEWEDMLPYPSITHGLSPHLKHPLAQRIGEQSALNVRNLSSLLNYVRAGFGITLLPRAAARQAPDLVVCALVDQEAQRKLYVRHLHQHSLPPSAEIFLQLLLQQLPAQASA